VDPDWDGVVDYEAVDICYLADGGKWKWKMKNGKLRLEKRKDDPSKFRMVMKDSMGLKVHMNMLISPGQTFMWADPTRPGKPGRVVKASIYFYGVNDQEKGAQKFAIAAEVKLARQIHAKLKEFAAQASEGG
jgi:hypothetical protein